MTMHQFTISDIRSAAEKACDDKEYFAQLIAYECVKLCRKIMAHNIDVEPRDLIDSVMRTYNLQDIDKEYYNYLMSR